MDYGLGLVLTFTDEASAGIEQARQSLLGLSETTGSISKDVNSMLSTQQLVSFSLAAGQSGRELSELGNTILGTFQGILSKVMSVGSEFENFNVTLEAMYGGAEQAQEAMDKLMGLSVETPFQIEDIKDLLVVLKSQGIDAFAEVTGSVSGLRQETLKWLGDLMAFKPDIPASRWRLAFTNFLGSGAPKVLENALDMGKIKDVVGDLADTPKERFEQLVQFIEEKNIGGLMSKQMKTFSATISNVEDQITFVWKKISDSGLYQDLIGIIQGVLDKFQELISSENFDKFLVNFSEALTNIVKPLGDVANKLLDFLSLIVDMGAENKTLVTMITSFAALAGVVFVAGGTFLKLSSSLANLVILFWGLKDIKLGAMFTSLVPKVLKFAGTAVLAYAAWKTNFLGIRTLVGNIGKAIEYSFGRAAAIVKMDTDSMRTCIAHLENSKKGIDKFTADIAKAFLFLQGVVESFTVGDGFTINTDTWDKLQSAGLLPMFEDFLDTKYKFDQLWEGFKEGFNDFSDSLGNFIDNINIKLEGSPLEALGKAFADTLKAISESDPKVWEEFGRALGTVLPLIVGVMTVVKIASPVIKVVSTLATIFGGIAPILKTVATGFMTVAGGIAAVLGVPVGVAAAILTAVIAIGALIVANWDSIKEAFFNFVDDIKLRFENLKQAVIERVELLKQEFTDFKNAVTTVISNFVSDVQQRFDTMRQGIESRVEAVKTTFSNLWEGLKSGAANAVDGIVSFFSSLPSKIGGFIDSIPVIGDVKKAVFGASKSSTATAKPKGYATGGVFTEPSFIEVGENGSEVVMPLEKNTGWISGLASNIGGFLRENFLGTTTSLSTGQVKSINPKPVSSNPQPQGKVTPPPIISSSGGTTNNDNSQVDNSVTFGAGAIVINIANATAEEAERLAELIMRKIQRKSQLNRMSNYKDINYQQPEFAY